MLSLQPIPRDLYTRLSQITALLRVDPEEWSTHIVPAILAYLETVKNTALAQGESFFREIDLKSSISAANDTVASFLRVNFSRVPPFTVIRLAEILCDPRGSGYSMESNASVLKFYHSLEKLVRVCSHMEGVRKSEETEEAVLVEIPWLSSETVASNASDGKREKKEKTDGEPSGGVEASEKNIKISDSSEEKKDRKTNVSNSGTKISDSEKITNSETKISDNSTKISDSSIINSLTSDKNDLSDQNSMADLKIRRNGKKNQLKKGKEVPTHKRNLRSRRNESDADDGDTANDTDSEEHVNDLKRKLDPSNRAGKKIKVVSAELGVA